jgi:hypothetical protein
MTSMRMEQLSKYLPLIVVVTLLCCVLLFLFSNSRLAQAVERLETAQARIDSTMLELSLARSMVDSVQHELIALGAYVHDIQGRVEILDLNQRAESDRFRHQQTAISGRLKTLYRNVEVTGTDLPEIPIVQGSAKNPPNH